MSGNSIWFIPSHSMTRIPKIVVVYWICILNSGGRRLQTKAVAKVLLKPYLCMNHAAWSSCMPPKRLSSGCLSCPDLWSNDLECTLEEREQSSSDRRQLPNTCKSCQWQVERVRSGSFECTDCCLQPVWHFFTISKRLRPAIGGRDERKENNTKSNVSPFEC